MDIKESMKTKQLNQKNFTSHLEMSFQGGEGDRVTIIVHDVAGKVVEENVEISTKESDDKVHYARSTQVV